MTERIDSHQRINQIGVQFERRRQRENALEICTRIKKGWRGLADFYVTTIRDPRGVMVECAGNTAEDSIRNAKKYLAFLTPQPDSKCAQEE